MTTKKDCAATKKAAEKLASAVKAAQNQCLCAARKSYDDVVATLKLTTKDTNDFLCHFKMIKCTMIEFGKGSKAGAAFATCKAQKCTANVSLDFLVAAAEIPSNACEPPYPEGRV